MTETKHYMCEYCGHVYNSKDVCERHEKGPADMQCVPVYYLKVDMTTLRPTRGKVYFSFTYICKDPVNKKWMFTRACSQLPDIGTVNAISCSEDSVIGSVGFYKDYYYKDTTLYLVCTPDNVRTKEQATKEITDFLLKEINTKIKELTTSKKRVEALKEKVKTK